jgi:tetratricopeptide (TPR) repeat protein
MIDVLLALLSLLALLILFSRRLYLLEKSALFGKMVLKRGLKLPTRLTKEDVEVTAKEMIPDPSTVDAKLRVKGANHFKKAELALKDGNLEEAEKLYIKAIAMDPSHTEAHAKLGMIYLNQEQYGKAELIYRKLILAITDDPVYYSNLGLSLFHQEKYMEAKEFYEKSIELDDTRPGRFYSLSRINHLLDDLDQAFIHIEKALLLDPDNVDYGLTIAEWHMEKDMHIEARKVLETIIEHWPDNQEAKDMLKQLSVDKDDDQKKSEAEPSNH